MKFALSFAVGFALLATSAHAQHEYSDEGALACLECHESETIMGILETPHANSNDPMTPAALRQCESCHGPSATHMKFPMQVANIRFSKGDATTPVPKRNAACLACHGSDARAAWAHSPHGFENVSCVDCHIMHEVRDPILSEQEQTLKCTESCHETILPTAPSGSHHPLTGKYRLLCTDCHNPHGPLELSGCNECHAQNEQEFAKQSPKARGYHQRALSQNIECTSCHKAFVHAMPTIDLSGVRDD